jgi:S1-C subfamily serine protease
VKPSTSAPLAVLAILLLCTYTDAPSINGTASAAGESGAAAQAPLAAGDDQSRIVAAVRAVKPSVVALNVTINGTQLVPPDPMDKYFGGLKHRILSSVEEQASGSGFVYDRSGLIVTNSHVVHGASRLQVVFANGDRVTGTLFAEDTGADLALVKVNGYAHLPPPLQLGASKQVQQGEWAIAIGEPFALQQTVTLGVVSGFNRDEEIEGENGEPREFKGLMQTSAAMNPGNSGGPLIDFNGRVIGVNQSTADPSMGAQGIGFAIPVDTLKSTAAALMQGRR